MHKGRPVINLAAPLVGLTVPFAAFYSGAAGILVVSGRLSRRWSVGSSLTTAAFRWRRRQARFLCLLSSGQRCLSKNSANRFSNSQRAEDFLAEVVYGRLLGVAGRKVLVERSVPEASVGVEPRHAAGNSVWSRDDEAGWRTAAGGVQRAFEPLLDSPVCEGRHPSDGRGFDADVETRKQPFGDGGALVLWRAGYSTPGGLRQQQAGVVSFLLDLGLDRYSHGVVGGAAAAPRQVAMPCYHRGLEIGNALPSPIAGCNVGRIRATGALPRTSKPAPSARLPQSPTPPL